MDAIDRYLERLAEPGMRAHLRGIYGLTEEDADQKPARRKTVAAAERKLGIGLPPSYKKLVTTVGPYDGGYEVSWIEDPAGLGADIVSANRERLTPFLIAVVPVDNGDSFCFDTRLADERGEYPIVRFDHEVHDEESVDFEAVASDLGAFLLGSLPEAPPPEAVERAAREASDSEGRGFWSRPQRRLTRVVEKISTALTSLRAEPPPRVRQRPVPTPLGAAIQGGNLPEVSRLLASGADPNAVSLSQTPLERSLNWKNREIASLLIEYGADLRTLSSDGHSSLLQIAFKREPELGVWLFRKLPDASVLDAAEAGTLEDLQALVDGGGDVNMVGQDRRRLSPLQAVALRRDLEMARFLLARGADLNYRGVYGPAVVVAATQAASAKMTDLLLRSGADPNTTNAKGVTPLYYVAVTCWFEVLETLIRGGADVNFRAPDGSSPLHQAAGRNTDPESRAIHSLVQHGAILDAQDDQGRTPLHAALERTHPSAAMTLIDLGADPQIRDHRGSLPIELISPAVKQYPGIPEVIRRINEWKRPEI